MNHSTTFNPATTFKSVSLRAERWGGIGVAVLFCLTGTLAVGLLLFSTHSRSDLFRHSPIPPELAASAQPIADDTVDESTSDSPPLSWAEQLAADLKGFAGAVEGANVSVVYGSRTYNVESGRYEVQWGAEPINVVKVVASADGPATDDGHAVVPVVFTGVFGDDGSLVQGEAIAYTDAPDLVRRVTPPETHSIESESEVSVPETPAATVTPPVD